MLLTLVDEVLLAVVLDVAGALLAAGIIATVEVGALLAIAEVAATLVVVLEGVVNVVVLAVVVGEALVLIGVEIIVDVLGKAVELELLELPKLLGVIAKV